MGARGSVELAVRLTEEEVCWFLVADSAVRGEGEEAVVLEELEVEAR